GFDVMIDKNLKPWLIEVNHSPSFNIDTPLDYHLKKGLITETLKLLAIDPQERIKYLKFEKCKAKERITGIIQLDKKKYEPKSVEDERKYHSMMEAKLIVNFIFKTTKVNPY